MQQKLATVKIWNRVFARKLGDVDSTAFRVTTDHAASSYGIPVLVDADGNAYGPADVQDGTVQAHGPQAEMCRQAGFTVVDGLPGRGGYDCVDEMIAKG